MHTVAGGVQCTCTIKMHPKRHVLSCAVYITRRVYTSIVRDAMCAGNNRYYNTNALTPRPVDAQKSPEHGAQLCFRPNTLCHRN
jgi:hypothetical protein